MLTQTSIELTELTVGELTLLLTDSNINEIKCASGKKKFIVGCVDGFYRQIQFVNGAIDWLDSW